MLAELCALPPDPILSLAARVRQDGRFERIDLGIGVYRADDGTTPVMQAVKAAERIIVEQQTTKSYLGPEGDPAFVEAMMHEAFGKATGLAGIQTVGGTGALTVATEVAAFANPGAKAVLGLPSWPNHMPILRGAGFEIVTFEHRATPDGSLDIDPMLHAIGHCRQGDLVLLHGCCHNPTGIDPTIAQWDSIITAMDKAGAIPLVDIAYQGFGRGWEADSAPTRLLIEALPEVLIAYSCDKNFGLYRDRAGMLLGKVHGNSGNANLVQHFAAAARVNYSMPPDHGAAVIRTIIGNERLRSDWRQELHDMWQRVVLLRRDFAQACESSDITNPTFARGLGMFASLPVDPATVERLATGHAIYLPPSGRINLAALSPVAIARLAKALQAEMFNASPVA